MWNGRQMVYGDGDKKVFGSFTTDLDIIAHELSHGVIQFTANLDYEFQPGALNESFSDVFGILVKQYALKQTVAQSNWLIGENIMLGKRLTYWDGGSVNAPVWRFQLPTWDTSTGDIRATFPLLESYRTKMRFTTRLL